MLIIRYVRDENRAKFLKVAKYIEAMDDSIIAKIDHIDRFPTNVSKILWAGL